MVGTKMIFPELIINKKNWNHIFHAYNNNKLPHALLFHGPEGVGKEGHAIELAAMLNCKNILDNAACGNCSSCKKTKSFQHENVKLILPLPRGKIASSNDSPIKAFKNEKALQDYQDIINTKASNPYFQMRIQGANTILINSIREIKKNLSLSIDNEEWKIILIFNAEKLCVPSPAAAHALLKVLEEPPDQTIIILVTSQHNIILDTIHSRCQKLYFPSISNEIIQDRLEKMGQDPVHASIIAHIASGDISLSKQLVEDYSELMEKLYVFLNACFSQDASIWEKCIDISTRLKNKDFFHLEQLFRLAILFYRDLFYYKSTSLHDGIIFKNHINKIVKLCEKYPEGNWHSCIQAVEATQNYILRNGYLPLMMMNLIIDIQQSIQGKHHELFNLSDWIST